MTWIIDPLGEPDLGRDDWTWGFRDFEDVGCMRYPENQEYYSGYMCCWGMTDGYANRLPVHPALTSYSDGYDQAQHERWCHNPREPHILGVEYE